MRMQVLQKTCQMTGRIDKMVKSETWVRELRNLGSLRVLIRLVEVDFPLLSSPSIGWVSYKKRKWFSFATTVRELVLERKSFNSVGNWLRCVGFGNMHPHRCHTGVSLSQSAGILQACPSTFTYAECLSPNLFEMTSLYFIKFLAPNK